MSFAFLSKDARWQKYRLDIVERLAQRMQEPWEILTVAPVAEYLVPSDKVSYRVFHSLLPRRWKWSAFFGALAHLGRSRPRGVLCLNNVTQLTEYAALGLCKMLGIRFVWWTHGFDHARPVGRPAVVQRLKERYALFFLRQGDAVVTFSEAGASYLVARGIPADRVYVAPNTLDTVSLLELAHQAEATDRGAALRSIGLTEDTELVLFSGRLRPDKRVADAIRTVAVAAHRRPLVTLAVIGDGPDAAELRALAAREAPGRVRFVGALYDDRESAKWFRAARIFLMPGQVGLGVVHAFCFGLPLLTTRVQGHGPELQYLQDGVNGYLCDEGAIGQLADRVGDVLEDPALAQRLSRAARRTAETAASVDRMLGGLEAALRGGTAQSRASQHVPRRRREERARP